MGKICDCHILRKNRFKIYIKNLNGDAWYSPKISIAFKKHQETPLFVLLQKTLKSQQEFNKET
jgi:hypothetical protein